MSMAVLQTLFIYKLAVGLIGPMDPSANLWISKRAEGVCGRGNCRYKSMEAHGILGNCNFKNLYVVLTSFVYAECLNSSLSCGIWRPTLVSTVLVSVVVLYNM